MQTRQEYRLEEPKPKSTDASGPVVQNVEHVLGSDPLIHDVSLVNARSDGEVGATNIYSIEPNPYVVKQSKIASTPLNVTELSPNRSHLMSPPRIRSFSAAAIGNQESRMLESGSSPLEQYLPGDYFKAKTYNPLVATSQQIDRPIVERTKPSSVSFIIGDVTAASGDLSNSNKPMPQLHHESDSELAIMIGDPAALDVEWKILDQTGENVVDLGLLRAWLSTRFPQILSDENKFFDAAINKAFHLIASSIGGDTNNLVPRRAFKRLLTAIIYIKRSLECFSSIDSSSNGYKLDFLVLADNAISHIFLCRNPRITFELFCSAVSKLGSTMDRKRCLFEYQGIHSRTKDYLQIDEFHSWLINSKRIKIQNGRERSGSARSCAIKRLSKSSVGDDRRARLVAVQKHHQQFINMVFSIRRCANTCVAWTEAIFR